MGECTRGAPSGLEEGRPATEAAPKAVQAHRHKFTTTDNDRSPAFGAHHRPIRSTLPGMPKVSAENQPADRIWIWLYLNFTFFLHHLNVAIHHEQTKLIQLLKNINSKFLNSIETVLIFSLVLDSQNVDYLYTEN